MKKTIYALLICSTLAVVLPSLSVTSFAKPAAATERTAVEATSDITARNAKETTFSENYKPRTGDPAIIMAHGSSAYRI